MWKLTRALGQIPEKDNCTGMNLATAYGHAKAATAVRDALDNKASLVQVDNNDVATALNPATITDEIDTATLLMSPLNESDATQIKNKAE